MNEKMKYGLIGVFIGGALVWIGATTAVTSNNTSMMQMMGIQSKDAPGMSSQTLDAHFIEQMIPHHEDAITMAKLAQTKAQRPEVKELADNIIISQGKEITQMEEWYSQWFGKDVPQGEAVMQGHGMMGAPIMHMGMTGTEADFHKLEEAEDFDRTFVQDMIAHHQMAVMMANMLKSGTNRPEMKQLADDIITAQTREIEQMRTWLTEWK